ncbi:MAG: hypothetical protein F6K19_47335 [Cyanothece sp. SIO1E1]|nr:hypothetical protein [Cyanothece sp. SIO1E1]
MAPATVLCNDELTAEITEVYAQALLRDVSDLLAQMTAAKRKKAKLPDDLNATKIEKILRALNDCCQLTPEENSRSRGPFKTDTLFRGITHR